MAKAKAAKATADRVEHVQGGGKGDSATAGMPDEDVAKDVAKDAAEDESANAVFAEVMLTPNPNPTPNPKPNFDPHPHLSPSPSPPPSTSPQPLPLSRR